MVSERIFGETGAPAREVTDVSKLRPGDIIVGFDKTGKISHVAIVEVVGINPDDGKWHYDTCDGNMGYDTATGGYVDWTNRNQPPVGNLGTGWSGSSTRAFTRYPEGSETESEMP